jgi:hypothetical protein
MMTFAACVPGSACCRAEANPLVDKPGPLTANLLFTGFVILAKFSHFAWFLF